MFTRESKVINQFSRFAHGYDTYNVIQAEVAQTLVGMITANKYTTIVDIGCGSGEVYKNIKKRKIAFSRFIALDSSSEMLSLHPSNVSIQKIRADFNDINTYQNLELKKETLLLSSSALQWSNDLEFVMQELSKNTSDAYFAMFTSNTFKTLHQIAKIESPIYPVEVLKKSIEKYYHASFELKEYTLSFQSVREMFHYIKKSGVSGGEKQLSYKQIKELMCKYPLGYLEFEVLFVKATSLALCK